MKLYKPYTNKEYADFAVYCTEKQKEMKCFDEYLEACDRDIPIPSKEEQKEKRAQAYLIEVDPITAHIQRERDEAEPDEEKIAALIEERNQKVQEIKERFPYPDE